MTQTPLSRSKGQRSRSPGRFTRGGVNASGSCSGERGNVLAVGTYCYVAVCTLQARSARRREALRKSLYRLGQIPLTDRMSTMTGLPPGSASVSIHVVCHSFTPQLSTPTACILSVRRGVNLGRTGRHVPQNLEWGRQCIMSPQILTFSLYFSLT